MKNIFLTKRRSFWTWKKEIKKDTKKERKKYVNNNMKKHKRKEDVKKGEGS